jgi:hypothetical protein
MGKGALMLASAALAVLLASEVALAATVDCRAGTAPGY